MTASKSGAAAQRLHRHKQGKHFQNPDRKTAGQAVKACPAVCVLWQIFFRDPIPADAEGAAPLHDLCRDLGQIFLAEAGLPKVGVKVRHRQDHPFTIILPVGEIIADQRTDDLGWNFLRKCRFHFFCQFRRQFRPLSAQRAKLQRIGKNIVKAQRPGTLSLGAKIGI